MGRIVYKADLKCCSAIDDGHHRERLVTGGRFNILKCNQEVTSGFSEHSKNFNKEPELLWPLVEICG